MNRGDPAPVPAGQRTVLVAEDDQAMRRVLAQVLVQDGYRVITAENGRVAIRHLEQTPIDLIVSDIFMPEGDGLELLNHLRTARRDCPVIVTCGGGRAMTVTMLRMAQALGARRILQKPFSLQSLLDAVHEILRDPRGCA